jgi:hypothetical protein
MRTSKRLYAQKRLIYQPEWPTGIPGKRDKLPSIAYSEELIFSLSATLQSTDQRHGMVGQEYCHFQLDS